MKSLKILLLVLAGLCALEPMAAHAADADFQNDSVATEEFVLDDQYGLDDQDLDTAGEDESAIAFPGRGIPCPPGYHRACRPVRECTWVRIPGTYHRREQCTYVRKCRCLVHPYR